MEMCFKLVIYYCALGMIGTSSGQETTRSPNITALELKKKLLNGYDKSLSPLLFSNSSESHWESVMMFIYRLQNLDETKGVLTTESYVGLAWLDTRMKFSREETGQTYVRFSPDELWTPAFIIHNDVQPAELKEGHLIFSFQGYMWWGCTYIIHTACVPNLKYFPFDVQHCNIEIEALTQDGDLLELTDEAPKLVQLKDVRASRFHIENSRWKLENSTAHSEKRFLQDGRNISVEIFTLIIKRTTPLIALGIMTPSVISALLILTSFWIQPGNSIRTGITVIGIIVSSSTLFTLGKILPVTGNVTPIIVEYAATSVILSMLSSIHSVIISVLTRLTMPFPFPYTTIINHLPLWALILLGLKPASQEETPTDQAFLFSELTDKTTSDDPRINTPAESHEGIVEVRIDGNMRSTTEPFNKLPVQNEEWMATIILLDRISFYVYLITCGLFVLSVMIKE